MALDPRIILAGQQPNIMNALSQGNQAAAQTLQMRDQNKLRDLYATQGAGIAAGDQNALNALAGIDPQAALGVQNTRLGMDNTRQTMDIRQQTAARLSREEQRAVEERAAAMSAAERAAEAKQIEDAVKMGLMIQTPEEWDRMAQQNAPHLVGQFANREALAAKYMSVAEVLTQMQGGEGPEWRPATPEEAAQYGAKAGQISQKTGKFQAQNPPSGMTLRMNPQTGQMEFIQGAGVGQEGGVKPSSPEAMISTIDGILTDPALEKSTGMFSFLQAVPGTGQRRFGARARQLEGQAFLQAFESLKGGGQITEIEGTKATQAIGRLDTAQSAEDYKQALTELRDILSSAQQRPIGWAYNQPDPTIKQGGAIDAGTVEDGYEFKGGDPADPANWEKVQ